MSTVYQVPAVQGEAALQQAISVMLRHYMQTYPLPADPALLALRFAWWIFDHPEELEAAAIEMEGMN